MRPLLEKLTVPTDASWALLDRRLEKEIPFIWHHHPEFELTLTLNSRGQRYVGDSIEPYDDGDLVLLGPNLPHTWCSAQKLDANEPHVALVMWFKREWAEGLMAVLAELKPMKLLLASANRGIVFSQPMSAKVRPLIEEMRQLEPVERLTKLIEVIMTLTTESEPRYLTLPNPDPLIVTAPDKERIELVLNYIHSHYQSDISVAELAELSYLSLSGFHRLFRRHTRMTLTDYVARLRIGEACSLLISTEQSIAYISDLVGYANLANFNRQFKALKLVTPREFRKRFR